MNESERLLYQQRMEAEAKLIAKAWDDEEFRRALTEDPKGTISNEFGVELPDEMEIEVVEETPRKRYLVLPQPMAGDLSDDELENVAGGIRHYGIRDFFGFDRLAAKQGPGFRKRWK